MTTVTDEMIKAGMAAFGATELLGPPSYHERALANAYTAMRTLEPVSPPIDGLVERLRLTANIGRGAGSNDASRKVANGLEEAAVELTRLSADNAAKDAALKEIVALEDNEAYDAEEAWQAMVNIARAAIQSPNPDKEG